ncbi:MAG: hypothetical protein QGI33_07860, partial [Candidatus Brocadiia bacterium]|nr:hypothetical protein [Candidatus Brocadiia bacterium]
MSHPERQDMLQPTRHFWTTKPSLLRILTEAGASDWCRHTFHFKPDSSAPAMAGSPAPAHALWNERLAAVVSEI